MRNIGDWVKIKSRDWYDKYKDERGFIKLGISTCMFTPKKSKFCGKIAIIIDKYDKYYWINLDDHSGIWIEEMFDDL